MQIKKLLLAALMLSGASATAAVREDVPKTPAPRAPASAPSPDKPDAPAAEAVSRGQLLYQNHRIRCHTSVVHVREKRRADSLAAIESWVRRWSTEEKLGWGNEEVVEVVDYLNQRYYRFPAHRKE